MESHSYQEPERRPMRPVHRSLAEPVSDYPPLPQRKPVQKQPPKPAPQKPEPVASVPQKMEPPKGAPQKVEPAKGAPQKVEPPKSAPQKVEPAKSVTQKVEPVKTVLTKEVKPLQRTTPKAEATSGEGNKDAKAVEEECAEPEAEAPAAARGPDGCFRLGGSAAAALEDELRQIMAKVSQELPAEPATDAERLVVGKLCAGAGDDIKKALGLNVTKRIVNQHNPLYVKLVFSGKPLPGRLQPWLRKWRVAAFKRVAAPGDTFAARLPAVAAFDRLCRAEGLSCGGAKVTVTPCYKFLTCPPNVKSIYAIDNEEEKDVTESNSASPQKQNPEKTEDKAKTEIDKVASKDSEKEQNKTEISESESEAKSEASTKNTTASPSPVKVNITIEGQTTKITEATEVEAKESDPSKKVTQNEVKTEAVKDGIEEMMVVDEHMGDDDEEEMTDQDILALMSGGIVLDECSGSDDE